MDDNIETTPDEGQSDKKGPRYQTSLEHSRAVQRALAQSIMSGEETSSGNDRIETALVQLMKVLGKGDLDEDKEIGTIATALETSSQRAKQARPFRQKIGTLVQDAESDWLSDSRLAPARQAWASGEYESAASLAETALKGSQDEFEERVQSEVRKRLGEDKKVDTGESTGGSGLSTDPARLAAQMRDPSWRKKHKQEVYDAIRSGKIKLGPPPI